MLVTVTLLRPVHMLLFEPIIGWMSLYVAFAFGILFAFFDAFPYVFANIYGFNIGEVGSHLPGSHRRYTLCGRDVRHRRQNHIRQGQGPSYSERQDPTSGRAAIRLHDGLDNAANFALLVRMVVEVIRPLDCTCSGGLAFWLGSCSTLRQSTPCRLAPPSFLKLT